MKKEFIIDDLPELIKEIHSQKHPVPQFQPIWQLGTAEDFSKSIIETQNGFVDHKADISVTRNLHYIRFYSDKR